MPRYKLTEVEKETVKAEMRAALIQLAREGRTATYTELCGMIESVALHPHSFILAHLMREVCGEMWDETGVQPCALIVSKTTGVPGAGYFRNGISGDDFEASWREDLEQVFEYYRGEH
jgi:hypothetical protein